MLQAGIRSEQLCVELVGARHGVVVNLAAANQQQLAAAEIGHHPRDGTDVARMLRLDEHDSRHGSRVSAA